MNALHDPAGWTTRRVPVWKPGFCVLAALAASWAGFWGIVLWTLSTR